MLGAAALLLLCIAGTSPTPARAPDTLVPLNAVPPGMRDSVAAVVQKPDIHLTQRQITYACSAELLNDLLDDLVLSADLWDSYRYRPRYIVRALGPDRYSVTDRKWIDGQLQLLYARDGTRLYYARGLVRLPGVPGLSVAIHGTTVVVIHYAGGDSTVVADVYTYSRLDDGVMRHMARAVLPVLEEFIAARMEDVIRKVRVIAEDIARTPGQVLAKMEARPIAADQIASFRRQYVSPAAP